MAANPIGIISMQFVRPFTDQHLALLAQIRELGFEFIELLVPEPEDRLDLRELRKCLEVNQLDVLLAARVNLQRSICSEDETNQKTGHAYLKYCLKVANELGAKIIGGPIYGEPLVFAGRAPYPWTAEEMNRRAERMIEGLSVAAEAARIEGKIFAVEPLNRFETDLLNTTNQAIELVDLVNNDGLGLLLDTFHMNMEDASLVESIKKAGSRIVHFQANENHRGYLGSGSLPLKDVIRALREIQYDGPISLEPFRRDDERLALPIAHWRQPDKDQLPKLQDSLQLIRSTLNSSGQE